MSSLCLRALGLSVGRVLFANVSLSLNENDRLGLVAGNGCGKSSLLKCVAGLSSPSEGQITLSRGLHLGYVAQEVPAASLDLSLRAFVAEALPPAEREENGWRIEVALDEFQIPAAFHDQPLRALSGGWQRMAMLARVWVTEPGGLLLDEPTNHLDMRRIAWLERWLASPPRRMPMIVASHDRAFLDACTTHTLFLRPEASKFYAHPYNKARALLAEDEAAEAAQTARDAREAERLRASANALKNIGINSGSDAAQRKSKLMAQRAEALEQSLRDPYKERSGALRLQGREFAARVLVSCENAAIASPDGRVLFRIGKFRVCQGDRVALLGANGVGKTLFVKALRAACGAEGAATPGLSMHPALVLGYADQLMSHLPERETAFDYIAGRFRLGDQRSRSLLAGAGFPVERQGEAIAAFSPGQRARLGLLALRLTAPNFYLLDEPTNHVDIPGRERLEEELRRQETACLFVSHDRAFTKAVATRFMLIERGRLTELDSTEAAGGLASGGDR